MTRHEKMPRARMLTALLVAAALAAPALLRPAPARAGDGCCTYTQDVSYYSDASFTPPRVGFCQFNQACSGQDLCAGEQTSYFIASSPGCCIWCPN